MMCSPNLISIAPPCLLATCLFACLFVCLFTCLLACFSAALFVYLFICLLLCLSVCLLACLFTCLLVYLFTCLPITNLPLYQSPIYQSPITNLPLSPLTPVDNCAFSVDNPVEVVYKTSRYRLIQPGFHAPDRWITCGWIAAGCGNAAPLAPILRRIWG